MTQSEAIRHLFFLGYAVSKAPVGMTRVELNELNTALGTLKPRILRDLEKKARKAANPKMK